ncbi:hypothetical protein F5884DRAFT_348473 [Xylogone sp. PMI_703]|nr:hypothetical protein F5884DRAFT_348473 [Xylogone sp. PMI_703]
MTSTLSLLSFIKEAEAASSYKLDRAIIERAVSLKEKHIIIIGTGITGLTLALSLHHFGHSLLEGKITGDKQCPVSVSIFERSDQIEEMGGMITLTPNSLRVLHQLGILQRKPGARSGYRGPYIVDKAIFVDRIVVDSVEGGWSRLGTLSLQESDLGAFKSSIRIWSHDMRNVLENAVLALPGVDIHHGMEAVRVEREESSGIVSAFFANHTSVRGDLIFGCDGITSIVRTTYVDRDRAPGYAGYCAIQTVCRHDNAESGSSGYEDFRSPPIHLLENSVMTLSMSKKGSILSSYLDDDRSPVCHEAIAQVSDLEAIQQNCRVDGHIEAKNSHLLPPSNHLAQTFRSIIEAKRSRRTIDPQLLEDFNSSDGLEVSYFPLHELPDGAWSRENICLLGSAAHAKVPSLLTGARGGIAIELALGDAYSLAKSLFFSRHQEDSFTY